MGQIKNIFVIMLKAMGAQAVVSLVIAVVWLLVEIGKKTQVIGIVPLGIAFCNAFFLLGLLCATIAISKIGWDFFWLKRDLSQDVRAQITKEGSELSTAVTHDMDAAKESRIIITKEKTWEIAFIVLGIVDFAISFALSMALISF